jgi:hypothetical protein
MSYIINNTRGQIVAVVGDGTINTTATDLALVGRAVTNYGDFQNENYVFLLENFANGSAPTQPILGQLWYDSSTDLISAYSTANVWVSLASQDYVQLQKVSPAFSGTPTAPTAAVSTNSTQLATTAFVQNNKVSPVFTGTPVAPTAAPGTGTTQIATTAFVQGEKVSPAFLGTPTAPTAVAGTNTSQLATTAFVSNSPAFNGVPTAPTAAYGTNTTQLATTEFVQGEKVSTSFSGIPTVPTAGNGVSTTQIASTEFVNNSLNNLGTMSVQNANAVAITGGTVSGITPLAVADGGTGAATAAAARTNLFVPPNSRTITGVSGLTGGGDLSSDRTITIATTSNGYGTRYIGTTGPNIAGVTGDIWYQIVA